MSGKKKNALVAVISDLTDSQAAQLLKDIVSAKQKHAPLSRGTVATGLKENVGSLIQKGTKKIGG